MNSDNNIQSRPPKIRILGGDSRKATLEYVFEAMMEIYRTRYEFEIDLAFTDEKIRRLASENRYDLFILLPYNIVYRRWEDGDKYPYFRALIRQMKTEFGMFIIVLHDPNGLSTKQIAETKATGADRVIEIPCPIAEICASIDEWTLTTRVEKT